MARGKGNALSDTKEYIAWRGMLARCYKPSEQAYRFYGAIGHYVCERWRNSFDAFVSDVGIAPSRAHSIDRRDTLKHYTCGKCNECVQKGDLANCRWATKAQQVHNQKNNLWFTHNGETKILKDWCRDLGLTYRVVHRRIYDHCWPFEKAIEPIVKLRGPITFRGETLTIKEWSDRLGIGGTAICERLRKGWSIERALTTPRLVSLGRRA